jgi:trk system potassium uptake protein TrkA
MRVVLVSSGHGAREFAADLCNDHDISIVHEGDTGRADLDKLDIEVIEGTGNDVDALKRAGVAHADWFIACTNSDEMNILACLSARRQGEAETVCFVTKEQYFQTFASTDSGHALGAPDLGIDHLVWPARMLADKIERILAVPGATDVGSFARGQIRLLEFRLPEGLPLIGRPLAELRQLPPGVLITGVRRGDDWFVPRGDTVLRADDRVLFMGRAQAMRDLAAWFNKRLGEETSDAIVLIGGGTVGERLAKRLEGSARMHIKLIEASVERCEHLAQVLKRTLVLNGDGCDLDLLESESVRYTDALVAVTDSDEKNLLASLLGRQLGIPKVITRVTSAANRRVFERVGIDVPLSARGAATEEVLHLVRHKEIDLLATLGEGKGHGEVLEVSVPEEFTPTALHELTLPPDSIVAAVIRKGEALVPGGATLIGPGDRCMVICKVERVAEVLQAFLG